MIGDEVGFLLGSVAWAEDVLLVGGDETGELLLCMEGEESGEQLLLASGFVILGLQNYLGRSEQ
jgi:hypothetical protein